MEWYEVFWKVNFILSLLLIQLLLSVHLSKKKYFLVKWLFFAALEVLLSIFIFGNWEVERVILLREIIGDKIGAYIVGGLTVIQMSVCYETKIWDVLYIFATAYCFQKIDFSVFMIVEKMISPIYHYNQNPLFDVFLYLLVLLIFSSGIYFFILKIIDDKNYMNFEKRKTTIIALMMLLIEDGIDSYMFVADSYYHVGGTLIVSRIYSIFFDIVMLSMLFNIIGKKVLQTENTALESLLGKRGEQYWFSKELINSINIKSHDLKKQISYLKEKGDDHKLYLEEIEASVLAFDTVVNTENETLSTILTEKSISCKRYQIPFSCIADGSNMDFIKEIDIYTLFANLLDNAIEASMQLPKERRSINLIVKIQNNFLSIHEENYFDGNLQMKDGYLKTTKKDYLNHGFGTRSMRMIVEKYDGILTVKTKDNIFQLNILIPIL